MIVIPVSLPVQPAIERASEIATAQAKPFGNVRLVFQAGTTAILQTSGAETAGAPTPTTNLAERVPDKPNEAPQTSTPAPAAPAQDAAGTANQAQTPQTERQSFWARLFRLPPMRQRLEKSLTEDWKFTDVRPRQYEWLLSDEGEEARIFFLNSSNARQYIRLRNEFGCGFELKNGRIVDDSFDTIAEYGQELVLKYSLLMQHRELIKRYFAGVFRDGRIGTQTLIRISDSMWFGPFEAARFRQFAHYLNTRFQVPNHVIGPMLASVGDSFALRHVLARKTAPQEFKQLLNKIAPPSTEDSGNAFAPALQLLVIGEDHKIPFKTLYAFLDELKLRPQDFAPFSAIEYNLAAYRLAEEIKCPTFAQFLRRLLDEYGADLNQESARLFILSFREFKDNADSLNALLSTNYSETKAFLKSVGTINPNVWNLERIAILTQTLTPQKRQKITYLARELSTELSVADIMFLADIADNEEECKLLLDRQALIAGVKDIPIDRIVERSHNDLVKELEREIENANRNGLFRTVRRLRNMISEEKLAYTERVDPSKLTNIQLSRLLIFHRSLEMPGFLETVGWNVSLDLQNDRSEGGGYLGYDKDMAMVTMVAGQPGDNKAYRPVNLTRAPASLALFHNHAFKDTFVQQYFGFMGRLFPFVTRNKNKNPYAGPSGWVGAKKGDISSAAESELPSFIITKIGYPQNPDGTKNKKSLLVNFDWVIVDKQTGEALRSDRGVYTVPHFGEEQLGKLKWPSRREQKRREREQRAKCPPGFRQEAEVR